MSSPGIEGVPEDSFSDLPRLDLEMPNDLGELDAMILSCQKESIGRLWERVKGRFTEVENLYGTDDDRRMSYHSTGGVVGRRVLLISTNQRNSGPLWHVVVNDFTSEDDSLHLNYREFTLKKDLLSVASQEFDSYKSTSTSQWTTNLLDRSALLHASGDKFEIFRPQNNGLPIPLPNGVVPNSFAQTAPIIRDLNEIDEILEGLSLGTHDEEIVNGDIINNRRPSA